MLSLRELQASVMHALLNREADPAAPFRASRIVAGHGISPAARLGIYANTAQTNFIDSIAASFPAIRRLLGEDYFRQCARGFHRRHPSQSGDLQPAGLLFADYLRALHADDEYRYLGEVARFEWLVQESLLAATHAPLDLPKLARVAPSDYDELHFDLHPTARLFASEYPCLRIWQVNVGSDAEPGIIDLSAGAEKLLIMRSRGELEFQRLTLGEELFLLALQAQERFGTAIERGAADAAFDPTAALQRFVAAGAIVN